MQCYDVLLSDGGDCCDDCSVVMFCSAMEVILENLVKRTGDTTEAAVAVQHKLAEATRKHTQSLKRAMEDTSDVSARYCLYVLFCLE